MARLVDADALLKEFDPNGERLDPILVRSRIVQAPTAYNPEKVVEEIRDYSFRTFGEIRTENIIEIVRKGGVEC